MLVVDSRHNIGSWIIKLFTFSKWNHCGVLFDEEDKDLDDCVVIDSTLATGVRSMTYKDFKKVYSRIEVIDSGAPDDNAGRRFAIEQIGKKYDWTALAGLVFQKRKWEDPDRWFCSELAEAIRVSAGRRVFRSDLSSVLPRDIYAVI